MKEVAKKLHHHLITGQVVFEVKNEAGEPVGLNQANLNAVVTSEKKEFPVRMIGKAQQAVQMHFHKKIGTDAPVEVKDVCLLAVSYLGHMTPEEFHAAPDGQKVAERTAKPNLEVVQSNSSFDGVSNEKAAEDRGTVFPEDDGGDAGEQQPTIQ